MTARLLIAAVLAGCAPEPRHPAQGPDRATADLLEACRTGRRIGPACERAQRAESARAAAARRALYREAFQDAP